MLEKEGRDMSSDIFTSASFPAIASLIPDAIAIISAEFSVSFFKFSAYELEFII